jgi:hypothetical protein
MRAHRFAVLIAAAVLPAAAAAAADSLKIAIAQRGQRDTAITERGQRSGFFAGRGLTVEMLYTQGGPEAHQAVISGSINITSAGGIESAVGGLCQGRAGITGSATIGSPEDARRGENGTRRGQKSGLFARGTSASFPEYHWVFSAQACSSHSLGLIR